jgi:hypothetical protein
MGKPTSDNGIPRPCDSGAQPDARRDRIRLTAMLVKPEFGASRVLGEASVVSDFRYQKEV